MYTVIWRAHLLDRLAAIYVAADPDGRERIAAGVEGLNTRLAADPFDVGESRSDGYGLAFPPLLRVLYYVDEGNRRALVTGVIRYGH